MLAYISRRLLLMIPTLIGITLMLFLMARFAPGLTGGGAFGEGGVRASKESREKAIQEMERKLNMLDENGKQIPLPRQYALWLYNACRGEFGESVKYNEKVSKLIRQAMPVTVIMNLIESLVVYGIAIPAGMLAAVKRGKKFDVIWGTFTIALFSLPVIWIGNLSIAFFANPEHLNWFPSGLIHSVDTTGMTRWQYFTDYLWHLVLPIIVSSVGGFAYLSKMMRGSMVDNLGQDYVRTARAKGVSQVRVISRHVFRNSLLPLITIFATIIPSLLGGSVIIEKMFSIPGMGQLALTAVYSRDLPILQAVTFIGSVLTLISLLLADICYAIADPRVSYD